MDTRFELLMKAELEDIACRREAMKAANKVCEIRNEYPAYGESDFEGLASEARAIGTAVHQNG